MFSMASSEVPILIITVYAFSTVAMNLHTYYRLMLFFSLNVSFPGVVPLGNKCQSIWVSLKKQTFGGERVVLALCTTTRGCTSFLAWYGTFNDHCSH